MSSLMADQKKSPLIVFRAYVRRMTSVVSFDHYRIVNEVKSEDRYGGFQRKTVEIEIDSPTTAWSPARIEARITTNNHEIINGLKSGRMKITIEVED